jgi:hypothetical protein
MDKGLEIILMDLAELSAANAQAIERVLMVTGDVAMKPAEKDERVSILRNIQITQDGVAKTFARIVEGAKSPPADLLPWLGQTAYLLNLYLNGYCPKDVARNLLEKIKANWPQMFYEVEPANPEQRAASAIVEAR